METKIENETKAGCFFEKINKIDKYLARLIEKKNRGSISINKIRIKGKKLQLISQKLV